MIKKKKKKKKLKKELLKKEAIKSSHKNKQYLKKLKKLKKLPLQEFICTIFTKGLLALLKTIPAEFFSFSDISRMKLALTDYKLI